MKHYVLQGCLIKDSLVSVIGVPMTFVKTIKPNELHHFCFHLLTLGWDVGNCWFEKKMSVLGVDTLFGAST